MADSSRHKYSNMVNTELDSRNYLVSFLSNNGQNIEGPFSFSKITGLKLKVNLTPCLDGESFKNGSQFIRGEPEPVQVTMSAGFYQRKTGETVPIFYKWFNVNSDDIAAGSHLREIVIQLTVDSIPRVQWTVKKAQIIEIEAATLETNPIEYTTTIPIEKMTWMGEELDVQYLDV